MVYRATSTSQGLPGIINICSILETVHIVADEWVVWTHQLQTPDATETPYVKQPLWNCFMSLLFLVFGVNWTGPPMWYMFGQKKYLVHWGKWTHETTRLGLGNAQIINLFTTPHTTLESYSIHQDDIFCHHAEKLMHALFLRDILKICESHTFFIGDSFFFLETIIHFDRIIFEPITIPSLLNSEHAPWFILSVVKFHTEVVSNKQWNSCSLMPNTYPKYITLVLNT